MLNTRQASKRKIIDIFFRIAIILQVIIIAIIGGLSIYKDRPCIKHIEELSRVSSPVNRVDALLVAEDCYLSDDSSTMLYLLPLNKPLSETEDINPIMHEKNIDIIDMKWLSSQKLKITYEKGEFYYELGITIEG